MMGLEGVVYLSVFDHAKSQLPEEVQRRVIQRWQYHCHGDKLNTGRPAVAGKAF